MEASGSAIPFLRSCKRETERPIEGEKKGEIPGWLRGSLIRIGSGLLEIGPDRFNHVFDGMALMHRFEFGGGRVTYQNRFLRSDSYTRNTRANRIVVSEFATRGAPDPCKTIFQRLSSLFDVDNNMTDNDLVNVVMYGGEAYACSETNNVWRIDTGTLESLKKVNLKDYVPIDGALAHAHEDSDGTVYNIGTSYGFYSHYNILQFPPKPADEEGGSPFESGSVVCCLPASRSLRPSYFHSFAMTTGHFVLVEQPLYLSLPRMAWSHFVAGTYADAMSWDPNTPSRFHVVRRGDGLPLATPYVAAPFFVFHHINAYEEDGHLVVDLCGYADGQVLGALYVDALRRPAATAAPPFRSEARRYVLPLHVDTTTVKKGENLVSLKNSDATAILQPDGKVFCTYEVLTGKDAWSPELPRINYERCNGEKYRYFYSIARKEASEQTYLIKVDTESKRTTPWSERDAIPSEPVFLKEPNAEDEDSGVLLASLLYRNDEGRVSALVLDAKTMGEVGRVTYNTESSVPGDFHGIFVTKNDWQKKRK